jgi:catechol 2,3-dioxygenase-like lactoylglutathione lyase family enzyme
MIDHVGLSVRDFAASKAFYAAALAPLGYTVLMEVPAAATGDQAAAGFGVPPYPEFWIRGTNAAISLVHVAFRVGRRADVDAFYAAALAAGGHENGPPGLRPHSDADYYGAFVRDPDGHNIEAVCRMRG